MRTAKYIVNALDDVCSLIANDEHLSDNQKECYIDMISAVQNGIEDCYEEEV